MIIKASEKLPSITEGKKYTNKIAINGTNVYKNNFFQKDRQSVHSQQVNGGEGSGRVTDRSKMNRTEFSNFNL